MKKRCFNCKCLQEESPNQFYKRTRLDASAKFYCRKCRKCTNHTDIPLEEKATQTFALKKTRQRYKEPGLFVRQAKSKEIDRLHYLSDHEKMAIGMFHRNCPEGCMVSVKAGKRYEFFNLKYSARDPELAKLASRMTKKMKPVIYEIYPFTPTLEQVEENQVKTKKRNKGSKFRLLRRLVKK